MTTDTVTRKAAEAAHAAAIQKADAAATLLAAAQADHEALQQASEAALDDLERAAELAEAQARVGHLIETHSSMLEAARRRRRAAAFDLLPFVAQGYREAEAEERDWLTEFDARTDELLDALCAHTGNETWRTGATAQGGVAGGRAPSTEKRDRMQAAWKAGRAARFIEIVTEGREDELLAELNADRQKRLAQPGLLGSLAHDPLNQGWGRRTTLEALPPELKAGGLYPLTN